ncbi:hypothetical protein B0J18DRAFT_36742 [Chaetomium sp. MPI-SDFR-AT-0129]|nr:hypothetical protein B0J18DRAFT_36742 [Chaetomium sp. MPI-SDFR-AT-0129]
MYTVRSYWKEERGGGGRKRAFEAVLQSLFPVFHRLGNVACRWDGHRTWDGTWAACLTGGIPEPRSTATHDPGEPRHAKSVGIRDATCGALLRVSESTGLARRPRTRWAQWCQDTMDQASCGSPKELGTPLSAMAASHRRPRPLATGAHLPIEAVEAVEPMLTCQWKRIGRRASVRFRMLVVRIQRSTHGRPHTTRRGPGHSSDAVR